MNAFERRTSIVERMKIRRFDTALNLAAEFGVSAKTVFRDVQELSCEGYPVQADSGRGGGIKWLGGKKDFPFTDRQLLALRNAMEVVSAEDKTVLEDMLRSKDRRDKSEIEISNNDIFGLLTGDKSQTQLAAELGVSGTLLSLVLSGKRKPSAELSKRIEELRRAGK